MRLSFFVFINTVKFRTVYRLKRPPPRNGLIKERLEL
jgi:hypothetical protein